MSNGEDGKNSDEGSSRTLLPQVEDKPSPVVSSAPRSTPAVVETIVLLNLSPRKLKRALLVLLLIVFLPFALYTAKRQYHFHIFHVALRHVMSGHGAMAAETLDPWRDEFVNNEPECELILEAYNLGSWLERLQWAAEACAAHGVESPQVHIATARFLIANGELDEAERALHKAAFKFKNPRAAVMLAHLYVARKKDDEALKLIEMAMMNMPGNPMLVLHAIEINSQLKAYLRADQIAEQNWALRNSREEPDLERVFTEAVTRVGRDVKAVGMSPMAGPPQRTPTPQTSAPSQAQAQGQPPQLQGQPTQMQSQPTQMQSPPMEMQAPPAQAHGELPIKLPSPEVLRGYPKKSGKQASGAPMEMSRPIETTSPALFPPPPTGQ